MTGRHVGAAGGDPVRPSGDDALLSALQAMWEVNDPPPAGLADRMVVAVALESMTRLEAELAVLVQEQLDPVGARAVDPARTLTFTSEHASVMVTLTPRPGGGVRLDGWVAPAGAGRIELVRTGDTRGVDHAVVDDQGRFVLEDVASGLVELVYRPAPGGPLTRAVASPAVRL